MQREAGVEDRSLDGPSFTCLLSGLRAPELASGSWKSIIGQLYEKRFGDLLAEISADSMDAVSSVVADFETGKQLIYASLELKFQIWETIPWKVAGLGHPEKEVAKRVAREALEAWDNLNPADVARQHRVAHKFFTPGRVNDQFRQFAATDLDMEDLEDLMEEVAKLRMIPVIERCIEAKHGLAHCKGGYRKVTPAYISLHLRSASWERGVKRKGSMLDSTILAFCTARKVRRLASSLGIDQHPRLSTLLATRGAGAQTSELWRATASVMYCMDPESQYQQFAAASKVNKRSKDKAAERRRKLTGTGVPRAPMLCNIMEKAQLEHFRSTACAGRVYSLPRSALAREPAGGAELRTLRAKLGLEEDTCPEVVLAAGIAEQVAAAQGRDADDAVDMLVPAAEVEGEQRIVISVLDSTPSRARVIPLPAGSARRLGPDDIQVVVHADHLSCRSEASGRISVAAAQVASNPVMVLSRLGAALVDHPEELLSWQVRNQVEYYFKGIASSEAVVDLATRLVNSGAMPGSGHSFACERESQSDFTNLEFLESFGFVVCAQDTDPSGTSLWRFSQQGLQCLEPCRVIANPQAALADRGLPHEEKTAYELLMALQDEGWASRIDSNLIGRHHLF